MGYIYTGTTITFGTSGFSGEILDISLPSLSRASVDNSHFATVNAMEYIPGTLYDGGEFTFQVAYDPGEAVPILGAIETLTVTFPAGAPGGTMTFDAFMTGFDPSLPFEDRGVADVTLKVTGEVATA